MKFLAQGAYAGQAGYRLLPLRFRRLPWDSSRVFVSSMSGDWVTVTYADLQRVVAGELDPDDTLAADLEARHLIQRDSGRSTFAPLLSQYRSRKAYLLDGPALHLFVVSLRCHHTCAYCQVSRRPTGDSAFDMSEATAAAAVDRLLEWPSRTLTVEFQGGEPLLRFDRVRFIVERIARLTRSPTRKIRFVLASTLHDLDDERLAFLKDHDFALSTSLDGPEALHNANRPTPGKDSYRRTVDGIDRARRALGDDAVSALTTLTRRSLTMPREIIDEYRRIGLHDISLRPLSPYGFARSTAARSGYSIEAFLAFYREALDHLLEINERYDLHETYASLLLSQLLTPFSHGYVDLRSPTGAGLGAVVYDYDGSVYPSDEARMLAAMGDKGFAIGRVDGRIDDWLSSPAMERILAAGVAESLPTCADCAFVPLCGADPIDHYARQGDVVGHRPSSDFCRKQTGLFDLLLQRWETGSDSDRAILERWALRHSASGPKLSEAA